MEPKSKGFKINGNLGWLSVLTAIIVQSASIGVWAGGVTKDVKYIKEDTQIIVAEVKEVREKAETNRERIAIIEARNG